MPVFLIWLFEDAHISASSAWFADLYGFVSSSAEAATFMWVERQYVRFETKHYVEHNIFFSVHWWINKLIASISGFYYHWHQLLFFDNYCCDFVCVNAFDNIFSVTPGEIWQFVYSIFFYLGVNLWVGSDRFLFLFFYVS